LLLGYSDPYCIITAGDQTEKSRIEFHTLNPTWNQTFEFKIPNDKQVKTIDIATFDYDKMGSDDSLGNTSIQLNALVKGLEKQYWLKLEGGEWGENFVGEAKKKVAELFIRTSKANLPPVEKKNKGKLLVSVLAVDFGIGKILFLGLSIS
jgi:Ca2+-dependent lipid-binding protein